MLDGVGVQIDQVDSTELVYRRRHVSPCRTDGRQRGRILRQRGDAAADGLPRMHVLAVLVIDEEVRVRPRVQHIPLPIPGGKVARAPVVSNQVIRGLVEDNAAVVVVRIELLVDFECVRIHAVDARGAVRAVLCERNPDVSSVVIDAAGVILVALVQADFVLQFSLVVHDKHVSDAFPRRPVQAIARRGVLYGRLYDFDGAEEEMLWSDCQALRVEGLEVQMDVIGQSPGGAAGEVLEECCDSGVAGRRLATHRSILREREEV